MYEIIRKIRLTLATNYQVILVLTQFLEIFLRFNRNGDGNCCIRYVVLKTYMTGHVRNYEITSVTNMNKQKCRKRELSQSTKVSQLLENAYRRKLISRFLRLLPLSVIEWYRRRCNRQPANVCPFTKNLKCKSAKMLRIQIVCKDM